MSDYERRQELTRERYRARAESARRDADSAHSAARDALAPIPPGQPILVGHYSERGHRASLRRHDRAMQRAIDAQQRAQHYEHKADGVGRGGISADDPDAAEKLRAKIAKLEQQREAYKARNRAARKAGEDPLPAYVLQNLGANIRRYRARLAEIESRAGQTARDPIVGDGFRVEECPEDNRIRFHFDERPAREVTQRMRRAGFRWSRTIGAWQRQLNNAGRYAAESMARELFGWERFTDCDNR